eukprot:TRINITY_DN9642_c0_g1_i1.p1 TRINITY_DN9642_c0_g1~~TRINITY_DN9642_c0_g1_i1.p1  ORF type:complete len:142 (-),score=15.04 TRINITY_DN9642_c0_g1_i1:111-536(-)
MHHVAGSRPSSASPSNSQSAQLHRAPPDYGGLVGSHCIGLYTVVGTIFENSCTRVYHAVRIPQQHQRDTAINPVVVVSGDDEIPNITGTGDVAEAFIIKTSAQETPTKAELAPLLREHSILKSLRGVPNVIQTRPYPTPMV